MSKHFITIVMILLILLMLVHMIPTALSSELNKVVVVGSIDLN